MNNKKKYFSSFTLILLIFIFCIYNNACAKIWYVRPYGYTFNKIVDGTSKEHAFYGLNGVVWGNNGVQAGDTLLLCREKNDPPQFTRTLAIKVSGEKNKEIIITSENKDNPAIIISASQSNYPGLLNYDADKRIQKGNIALGGKNINYIHISNIKIENCYGIKFDNCFNITIDKLFFKNVVIAILLIGGDNNIIENCAIDHVVNAGIALLGSDPASTTPLKNCIIRNNKCGHSLEGDGITLHNSNDGNSFSIGSGNKVINNICYGNHEEGLDITSGTDVLVEGNITYKNGRCATIAHTASRVTFVRHYSHDEKGVLIHPSIAEGSIGDIIFAYNIIDCGNNTALVVSENKNFLISNNLFRSTGKGIKPATLDIRLNAKDIIIQNNIIISANPQGYLLRLGYGTSETHNVKFYNNCWWQPSGMNQEIFYDKEHSSYNFSKFTIYAIGEHNIFADPKIKDDFHLSNDSPCINAGSFADSPPYHKDYAGNKIELTERTDIGPILFNPMPYSKTVSPPDKIWIK